MLKGPVQFPQLQFCLFIDEAIKMYDGNWMEHATTTNDVLKVYFLTGIFTSRWSDMDALSTCSMEFT